MAEKSETPGVIWASSEADNSGKLEIGYISQTGVGGRFEGPARIEQVMLLPVPGQDTPFEFTLWRHKGALLHFALNPQAQFRWVAAPGEALVIPMHGHLEWTTSPPTNLDVQVMVFGLRAAFPQIRRTAWERLLEDDE